MHVTALPDGFRQHFPDRGFEAGVIIRDHELDAGQAAFSQAQKKVAPARPALAIGEFHGEDLPPAFPVHSNGHEYSLAYNDPALPATLVTGIENEIRERVCKPPSGKRSQALVEGFVDGADRTRRKAVTAQGFRDRLHFPCRNALHIHLRQSPNQGFLRALIALEQLRGKPARTVLRNPKLQSANPRDQGALVIAAAITKTPFRPLAFFRGKRLSHLRFQRRLNERLNRGTDKILVPLQ